MNVDPRAFAMSVFDAAIELRRAQTVYPDISVHHVADILLTREATVAGLDYKRALEVEDSIGWLCVPLQPSFEMELRSLFKTLILAARPTWMQVFALGRQRLIEIAHEDVVQVLRSAGLLDPDPDAEVVEWWDSLAAVVRLEREAEKLKHGREAEALSIEYEKERLRSVGINLKPVLIALDDNLAGFDILSYDPGTPSPSAALIEVKSASDREQVVVLTRREWDRAVACRTRYEFHIWRFPSKTLVRVSVSEMKQHIPVDQGKGAWERARINIAD